MVDKTKQIQKVLVIHKRSLFKKYVLNKKSHRVAQLFEKNHQSTQDIELSYREHNETLRLVFSILKQMGVKYDELRRRDVSQKLRRKIRGYDLIVTVGGDGTFLKASHFIKDELILGINSAPSVSVGAHCTLNANDLEVGVERLLNGHYKIKKLNRLLVEVNDKPLKMMPLNDVLFANNVPAAMSRYLIKVGNKTEDQKSSGVWVSTPSGSTAAIRAAGGSVMTIGERSFQYLVREPYPGKRTPYVLVNEILKGQSKVSFINKMIEACLYLDGVQDIIDLEYGDKVSIALSSKPLHVLDLD